MQQTGQELEDYPTAAVGQNKTKETVSVAELQHPRKARSLILKAQQALRQGDIQECFQDLDKAEKARSAEPYVLGLRGAAHLITRRIPDAISELQQAVQILPLPGNYSNLGYAYVLSGQTDLGEQELERAVSSPNSPLQSHYLLGVLLLDQKPLLEDACRNLSRAVNLMPSVHLALAVCYTKQGLESSANSQIHELLGPQDESRFDFWQHWVERVAAEPKPSQAFGLFLHTAPVTQY